MGKQARISGPPPQTDYSMGTVGGESGSLKGLLEYPQLVRSPILARGAPYGATRGYASASRPDIATVNPVAALWRLKKVNAELANPKLNT